MKKPLLFIFYFSLFCVGLVALGHVTLSIAESKFKGALCHSIDKKECEERYETYLFCVDVLKESQQFDLKIIKEYCFKAAFFDIEKPKDEHN